MIKAFALGLVMALFLLEIILRLVGAAYTFRHRALPASRDGKTFTILCIGDSFVYGLGAPPDKSYPLQLEALLRERTGGTAVRVVNTGTPGENLCQIYERFRTDVDEVRPDVVVLLGGMISNWNMYGYHEFREGRSLSSRAKDLLNRVRVYRLVACLFAGKETEGPAQALPGVRRDDGVSGEKDCRGQEARELFAQGLLAEKEQRYEAAAGAFAAVVRSEPDAAAAYRHLGELARLRGDIDGAAALLREYLRYNPRNSFVHADLGNLCRQQRRYEEAFRVFRGGIEAASTPAGRSLCVSSLVSLYEDAGAAAVRPAMKEYMTLLQRRVDPDTASLLAAELDGRGMAWWLHQWRGYDIGRIAALCREKKALLILQNYPETDYSYRKTADELGIPFVDNRAVFARAANGLPRSAFFSNDANHCNAAGYRLMARNVADKLLELGLLRQK